MKTPHYIAIVLLVVFSAGCVKTVFYPVEPHIEFVSFTKIQNSSGVDSKAILTLSFTDGDGDIGITDTDTLPPFKYGNLIINYFEKQNGVFTLIPIEGGLNGRIPFYNSNSNKKGIKGTIEYAMEFFYNPFSPHDTICFEIYLLDRAKHKSNVIRTPAIVVKKH